MAGLVTLIGVGPGDPGLLTLRGAKALSVADVVLYDALVHPAILGHARPGAELLFVGKRRGADSTPQEAINHMLLFRAAEGKRVARLKGGDPLLFGRGAEELEFLAQHGIACEVVPGVTAALGATAYAGIPLSHRALSSSIALLTSTEAPGREGSRHDWARLATATQTLVFYMGLHRLADDLSALVAAGRAASTPAAVISMGTHPEQRVVTGTLETLAAEVSSAQVRAPALVVVGEVVRLRETLDWWSRRPLAGLRVAVTRAAEASSALTDMLTEHGAAVFEAPATAFAPPDDPSALRRALAAPGPLAYELAIFTSRNAVTHFFGALGEGGRDARALGLCRVAAVGAATAEALSAHGITADFVPSEAHAEGLLSTLDAALGPALGSARVLFPRAQEGRDVLPEALKARGARVDLVPVYKTVAAPPEAFDALAARLAAGALDVITFAASSAAAHTVAALGAEALARCAVASIGPATSETLRQLKVKVDIEAREHSFSGLVAALSEHVQTRSKTP
ncbi:MAG: uroporphyrinogen-III C-methyltransferase [Myxococcales bacterium]|nr:uroporphyrinogen-III C-methyltransferase [Myxococcales bacterium]